MQGSTHTERKDYERGRALADVGKGQSEAKSKNLSEVIYS
jgi:hypothetical protein